MTIKFHQHTDVVAVGYALDNAVRDLNCAASRIRRTTDPRNRLEIHMNWYRGLVSNIAGWGAAEDQAHDDRSRRLNAT